MIRDSALNFWICVHALLAGLTISDLVTWILKDNGTGSDDLGSLTALKKFDTGRWISGLEL